MFFGVFCWVYTYLVLLFWRFFEPWALPFQGILEIIFWGSGRQIQVILLWELVDNR